MLNFKTVLHATTVATDHTILRAMRFTVIIGAAVVFQVVNAHAQTVEWTKYRDDQIAASVSPACASYEPSRNFAKDIRGNIFVVGGAFDYYGSAVIYKFDGTTGALVWRKNYVGAGTGDHCATSVAIDSAGNVAVAGYSTNADFEVTSFVSKYNGTTGELIWAQTPGVFGQNYYLGQARSALAIDQDGNIIVTNLATTKYNGVTGVEIWSTWTPLAANIQNGLNEAIVLDANGDVYICGSRTAKLAGGSGAELWSVGDPASTTSLHGKVIRLTPSNGLVVTGYTGAGSSSNSEIVTVKYQRQTGDVTWQAKFSSPDLRGGIAKDVTVDLLGNILVTGYTTEKASPESRLPVLKYTSDGTLVWATLIPVLNQTTGEGAGTGNAVLTDPDGSVFVTGSLKLPNNQGGFENSQWVTFKFDGNSGAEQWRKTYTLQNSLPYAAGIGILFDATNDPIVLGYASDTDHGRSVRILKYVNANGVLKFEASSNLIDATSEAQTAVVDNNGNLIIAGIVNANPRIVKYDGVTGDEIWNIAAPVGDQPLLAAAANGDILFTTTSTALASPRTSISRLSGDDGRVLWFVTPALDTLRIANAMKIDASGDIYVTGSADSGSTYRALDARTVKLSGDNGAELWKASYAGLGGEDDFGSAIAIAPDGHLVVGGVATELIEQRPARQLKVEKRNKSNGALIWSAIFGPAYEGAPDVVVDLSGNIFVSGYVGLMIDSIFVPRQRVSKYEGGLGNLLWTVDAKFGGVRTKLNIDTVGNPIIADERKLTKRNGQTGNEIWTTPFLGFYRTDTHLLDSGQIVASGRSSTPKTRLDMRVALYDSTTGAPIWSYGYDGGALSDDNLTASAVKGNSIFVAGSAKRFTKKPSWFVQRLSNVPAPAPYPLNLLTNGTGSGVISASPNGSACEPTCNGGLYPAGTMVTITPTPSTGSIFAGWSGACIGLAACQINMSKAQFVSATFNLTTARSTDLNGDRKSDLIVQSSTGVTTAWLMNGTNIASGADLIGAGSGWTISHIADFNGDGKADILWRHTDGRIAMWLMNGTSLISGAGLLGAGSGWSVTHVADFNGDGRADILYRHTDGRIAMWLMDGTNLISGAGLLGAGSGWSVTHVADFNGDGRADILYANTDGRIAMWLMNGTNLTAGAGLLGAGSGWSVTHTGDFDGDGRADILYRNTDGRIAMWLMDGTNLISGAGLLGAVSGWSVTHVADFNGDGKADILYANTDGRIAMWLMNGTNLTAGAGLIGAGSGWSVTHTGDFNGDGKADIVYRHTDGRIAMWLMNGTNLTSGAGITGPGPLIVVPPSP